MSDPVAPTSPKSGKALVNASTTLKAGGMRRATVFGGSGFIGRHIVRELARQGIVVRAAVRDPEAANFLRVMGNVGQVAPIYADVRNEDSVRAAVDGVDIVVNAVGLYTESRRARFDNVHVIGAENVARLSKEAGVQRLVYLSGLGTDKDSPSAFVRARAAGEERVMAAFPTASILKPSVVFGPGDHFCARMAQVSRYLPFIPLPAGGDQKMQPVYVGDVADAALAAMTDPAAVGQRFHLGGPKAYRYRDLMALILKHSNRKRLMLSMPNFMMWLAAFFMEFTPRPMITRDQLKFIGQDNIVPEGVRTLADLGVGATSLEAILPSYLDAYRKGGQYRHREPA